MFKRVVFLTLFAIAFASSEVSQLFDSFLKHTVEHQQLVDGSSQTTYFNIPHRSAPGLIEPFLFGTRATAEHITVSNIQRVSPVLKEVRRQHVSDGDDYDYTVMATTVGLDIKVTNLAGDLTTFVGDSNKGRYSLSGNLRNLVMNVTMQTEFEEYLVFAERSIVPTTSDLAVTGDDQERATVESNAAQIIGDLVTTLFSNALSASGDGDAGKALEQVVRADLAIYDK